MSKHSYSCCWIHIIWGTLNREKLLPKSAQEKLSQYLYKYAESKDIYMKINHVNPDHVHTLIDLPTKYTIEETVQLLKGSSSHWANQNNLISGKLVWGRGYGAFSISHSKVDEVIRYITNQEEHHRKRTFVEEYEVFLKSYGFDSEMRINR